MTLPYTAVSQNELDISRAREKSLNTRYTVYAITDAPPNFGGSSREATHVTRAASRRKDRPFRFDDTTTMMTISPRAKLRQFSFNDIFFRSSMHQNLNDNPFTREHNYSIFSILRF